MSRAGSYQKRSQVLNRGSLRLAATRLAERDKNLALIHSTHGPPPLWHRASGFATLSRIILEQQVSLRSAAAMFDRLSRVIQPFEPANLLMQGENKLRELGVTRQKANYLAELATAIVAGRLDLKRIGRLDDTEARAALMSVKGIGAWSADVYLLMVLRRADVWPAGDLALSVAARDLLGLATRPSPEELSQLAERWRPHRAVAARMLWQYYLARRAAKGT